MSLPQTTGEGERERPLAAYFESLPRESADRGSFTPDDVADIIHEDRNGTSR